MHEHGAATVVSSELGVAAVALAAIGCYVAAVIRTRRRRPWPLHRTVLWILGVVAASLAVVGPLADAAHENFVAHMAAHLSLGMLAPLLFVLAAPVTLALRSLAVVPARRLSALLRSWPARFLVHPITATVLNVGGLWVLYTTDLMPRMHDDPLLAAAVNVHLLVAGYLFTASMIGLDPAPHRTGYVFRAVVLLVAFAAHGILAKYLFAHPPAGVPADEAELGSTLMFYGGDLVDAAIIVVLCARWYADTRPERTRRRATTGSERLPA
jgi:putative membrane protein